MNSLILVVACAALGQAEPKETEQTKEVEAWRTALNAIAREHRIVPDRPSATPFRLVENPVFVWYQPIRSGQIGSLYLWLQDDGRPAAAGAIFCWARRDEYWAIIHEFHSLADTPLQAAFRDTTIWRPAEPGLQWQPLPIDTAPALSSARQLSQIRQISRRFQAHTVTPEGEPWQLRLLPRPLYEYSAGSGDSMRAGAVLALCQDMDPEMILVLEARPSKKGIAWHYACGTFTDYETHLNLGDQEIWTGPASPGLAGLTPEKVYWRDYITRRALPPKGPGQAATWTE